jgi:hypothetical protein
VVNAAMIELYWGIGKTIVDRQSAEPWGVVCWNGLLMIFGQSFPHEGVQPPEPVLHAGLRRGLAHKPPNLPVFSPPPRHLPVVSGPRHAAEVGLPLKRFGRDLDVGRRSANEVVQCTGEAINRKVVSD